MFQRVLRIPQSSCHPSSCHQERGPETPCECPPLNPNFNAKFTLNLPYPLVSGGMYVFKVTSCQPFPVDTTKEIYFYAEPTLTSTIVAIAPNNAWNYNSITSELFLYNINVTTEFSPLPKGCYYIFLA
jgi:hypothetical protein